MKGMLAKQTSRYLLHAFLIKSPRMINLDGSATFCNINDETLIRKSAAR